MPIESYVYSLFDRLVASGVFDTSFVGIRPWTRAQCAQLVEEADERLGDEKTGFAEEAVRALKNEFKPELTSSNGGIAIDDIYVRTLGIAGPPLTDFHFGQTTINDYGRVNREGSNGVVGIDATALHGPMVLHVRGEFQHAPAGDSLSPTVVNFIRTADLTPDEVLFPQSRVDRFRLIEAYAGLHIKNVNVTVGKQALWWGPSPDTASLYSNNSEPIYMLRIEKDAPTKFPWIFGFLGPARWDAFFGRLYGHHHPTGPYFHGQKISFKPTRDLELGFSRTVEFAGAGHPLTFRSFWRSFISVGDSLLDVPGSRQDLGDRRGAVDFSYRLPGLRDWVTLYGDFFTDDDPAPLSAPHRSGLMPGIYIAKIPHLHRLDLRIEALDTDQAAVDQKHGGFFYFNEGYKDGYTNDGSLIGSWIGRDSKAILATSRYWVSATTDASLTYRNTKLAAGYVPGGGTQHDLRFDFRSTIGHALRSRAFVQYEQWNIPLLATGLQKNVSVGFELSVSGIALRKRTQ